jgi:glutathione S-transferase
MAEFRLHCFGESGNSYKVALMLELTGCDWEPVFVRFFKGATRSPEFRSGVNAMGEAPVLEHRGEFITQSGVILDYLAELTGKFAPETPAERREVMRWIFYDNHKFTSYFATLRFLAITSQGDPAVVAFLKGRAIAAYKIVETHLATSSYLVGDRPTIADLSLVGYRYYTEETGIDFAEMFPHIQAWADRIRLLPGWKAPYDLMPRA